MANLQAKHEKVVRAIGHALCSFGLIFLVAPIAVVIPLSFSSGSMLVYPLPGLSLRWYEALATSGAWRLALANSLLIALVTTVVATALGGVAAIGIIRLRARFNAILMALLISPMIIPGVVIALATFLFYSPLGLAGNLPGIIVAHSILGIPFVIITMSAALLNFDNNLMRAAIGLGATPLTAYRRIMLPLISPALIASALFVFVTSFDEFIVVSFLAGPEQHTLPLQMWSGVHDDVNPTILAAATLFVLASVLMLFAIEILRRRTQATIASRPTSVKPEPRNGG